MARRRATVAVVAAVAVAMGVAAVAVAAAAVAAVAAAAVVAIAGHRPPKRTQPLRQAHPREKYKLEMTAMRRGC